MVLPSMIRTWGSVSPPKSDTRWICFPYLTELPRSNLDLPRLMRERNFSLDIMPDVPQVAPLPPETPSNTHEFFETDTNSTRSPPENNPPLISTH